MGTARTRKPLGGRLALPPRHTLLLQAALCDGFEARATYRRWADQVDFGSLDVASQRTLPLLVANEAARDGAPPGDDPVMARCAKVVRFTWLKSRFLMAQTAPAIRALRGEGVPVMALKGAAVVIHTGGGVAERPMDDIDLAVPQALVDFALAVMDGLGFAPAGPRLSDEELRAWFLFDHGLELRNRVGASVDLHWHVFGLTPRPEVDEDAWSAALAAQLGAEPCLVTSVEHTIVSVIGHAMQGPGIKMRWATDIASLIRAAGPGRVDWERVIDLAARQRMSVGVGDALELLHRTVGLDIPPEARRMRRARSIGQQLESRVPVADRTHPPGRPTVLSLSFMEHRRRTEAPGRGGGAGAFARFLSDWLALPGPSALPRRALGHRASLGGAGDKWPGYPLLATGREVRFDLGGDGRRHLGPGWAQPEAHGTWSIGAEATFGAQLEPLGNEDMVLFVRFVPFLPPLRPQLRVRLLADGRQLAGWEFTGPGWKPVERSITVSSELLGGATRFTGRFLFDYPVLPDLSGSEAGARAIAISLNSLRFDRQPSPRLRSEAGLRPGIDRHT